jgi:hypothetical protein
MSKKEKNSAEKSASSTTSHTAEYHIIRHDLIRVLILNGIYLAAVLGIYFTDQKTHYLQPLFAKILHF